MPKYDSSDEHRHQKQCKDDSYRHRDPLLRHLSNESIDWVTEPLIPGKRPLKSGFEKLSQDIKNDIKESVTVHWDKADVVNFFEKYKIYNTPTLKDFLWPPNGRDHKGAYKAYRDPEYGTKNRRQDFPWAFNTKGEVCDKAKEKFVAMENQDPAVRSCKIIASIENRPQMKSQLQPHKPLPPQTTTANNTTGSEYDDEDNQHQGSADELDRSSSGKSTPLPPADIEADLIYRRAPCQGGAT